MTQHDLILKADTPRTIYRKSSKRKHEIQIAILQIKLQIIFEIFLQIDRTPWATIIQYSLHHILDKLLSSLGSTFIYHCLSAFHLFAVKLERYTVLMLKHIAYLLQPWCMGTSAIIYQAGERFQEILKSRMALRSTNHYGNQSLFHASNLFAEFLIRILANRYEAWKRCF